MVDFWKCDSKLAAIPLPRSSQNHSVPPVTIITGADDGYKRFWQYSHPSWGIFTELHGFQLSFRTVRPSVFAGLPHAPKWLPYWAKIIFLLQEVEDAREGDIFVWVDVTVVPTVRDARWVFRGISTMQTQGKRLLVCRDVGERQLNTGLLMVWAGPEAQRLLTALLNLATSPSFQGIPPAPPPRMAPQSGEAPD